MADYCNKTDSISSDDESSNDKSLHNNTCCNNAKAGNDEETSDAETRQHDDSNTDDSSTNDTETNDTETNDIKTDSSSSDNDQRAGGARNSANRGEFQRGYDRETGWRLPGHLPRCLRRVAHLQLLRGCPQRRRSLQDQHAVLRHQIAFRRRPSTARIGDFSSTFALSIYVNLWELLSMHLNMNMIPLSPTSLPSQ